MVLIELEDHQMSAESITAAALALTPEEKAKLAEQLLDSLDRPDQAEIDTAWAEEAERRIDRLDRGEERTVPADQALRDARARLK
jgi:putative addiction module component (TIGR02574 family)